MIMSHADIVREYKAAKTPMKQIGILADQNLCNKRDIVDILLEAGCEVPKVYTKTKEKKEDPAQTAADINVGTRELEPVQEIEPEADTQDSFMIDVDEIEPIGDIFADTEEIETSCSAEREQKLRDALMCVGVYGFGLRRDTKKIRSLGNGIKKISEACTEVDMSESGAKAIMQAIAALAEEISLFLYIVEDSMEHVDKVVTNALLPQETTKDGE